MGNVLSMMPIEVFASSVVLMNAHHIHIHSKRVPFHEIRTRTTTKLFMAVVLTAPIRRLFACNGRKDGLPSQGRGSPQGAIPSVQCRWFE